MDPGTMIWLEILIYGGILFSFMYFVAVKGPIAGKVRGWLIKAREARIREMREKNE